MRSRHLTHVPCPWPFPPATMPTAIVDLFGLFRVWLNPPSFHLAQGLVDFSLVAELRRQFERQSGEDKLIFSR